MWLAIAAGILGLGAIAWLNAKLSRAPRPLPTMWKDVADALGLEYRRDTSSALTGTLDGWQVWIREEEDRGSTTTTIVVDSPGAIHPDLGLTRENTVKLLRNRDPTCGDPDFDDVIRIQGPEVTILAALNHRAREQLMKLAPRGVRVEKSSVRFWSPDATFGAEEAAALIRSMVDLAKAVSVPKGTEARALAAVAVGDPLAQVRLNNLRALASFHPRAAETAEAGRKALHDPDGTVRLAAARLVGGDLAFDALGTMLSDRALPLPVRVEALRLAVLSFAARAVPLLGLALDGPELELRVAAVHGVKTMRATELTPRLCKIATAGESCRPQLAAEICRALQVLGDASAEPALLALLSHGEHEVRRSAAEALGAVGTISSVQHLGALYDAPVEYVEVRKACLDSMRRIQSRLGDVGAGRVSLAPIEGAAGSVSLSAGPGALSVPDPAEGVKTGAGAGRIKTR